MSLFEDLLKKRHHDNDHYKHKDEYEHRSYKHSEHDRQPWQRDQQHESFGSYIALFKRACSNPLVLTGVIIIALLALVFGTIALLFLLRAFSYVQGTIAETGIKGIVDTGIEILQRLWLGNK